MVYNKLYDSFVKFIFPKIIHNLYIKYYQLTLLMNRNLKVATFGVILAAALAFGIVATTGLVTTGNLVAPVHAQAPPAAPPANGGGNMSGGNATGGNMTK
jgi:hypothetical protein